MDTKTRRRRNQTTIPLQEDSPEFYSESLSFYQTAPPGYMNLEDFAEVALERMKLHRILEQTSLKDLKPLSKEWKKSVRDEVLRQRLKQYSRLLTGGPGNAEADIQAKKADCVSHFTLRLIYCRSTAATEWFIARELEWFSLRFSMLSSEETDKFLLDNHLSFISVEDEEKDRWKEELAHSAPGGIVSSCDFYKVPYEEAIPLVRTRKVFLHNGFAFVPTSEVMVCVEGRLTTHLEQALILANIRLPHLSDQRILEILEKLQVMYTGPSYIRSGGDDDDDSNIVQLSQLDLYSKKHFPLCMQSLYNSLKTNHHLKNMGRLQLGLFLKGIGLPYEQALEFWKREFTKLMDIDQYTKRYEYNFKHQFGKVGKMVSYTPFSCTKIVNTSVGAADNHGCPFKHWDTTLLIEKILDDGVRGVHAQAIVELANKGHYQLACGRYFEQVHCEVSEKTILHPNQYFDESRALFSSGEKKEKKERSSLVVPN